MDGSPYVAYLLWSVLEDVDLEDARAVMADLAVRWPTSRWRGPPS
jgi:hypothetical protein